LFDRTENVSVILLESSDSGQTRESARDLITVENTKIGKSKRQISVGADLVIKHYAVGRAVHRFHTETLSFNLPHKNVFFVCLVVARSLPKIEIENIRRQHLIVSSYAVLLSNQRNKFVIDNGAVRVEERTAR